MQYNERVHTLDVIRGLCLLGILVINVFGFFLPMPYIDLYAWYDGSPLELIWYENIAIYIHGSIYPLFAMLFGYGVAIQYNKALANGVSFYSFAPRRFVILLVIGLVHGMLIWWGDILFAYAICALVLLAFIRLKPAMLLVVALLLNGIWHVYMLFALGYWPNGHAIMEPYVDITTIEHVVVSYTLGSWTDTLQQRVTDFLFMFQPLMWLTTLLPYMLLGAAASKLRLVERVRELKWLWLLILVVTLGVGIYVKSLFVLQEGTYFQYYAQTFIGGPLVSIGYASIIVLICALPKMMHLCKPLASLGRMSMTMYLLQSVVMTTISYQYGAALYGKLAVNEMVLLAIGFFVVQVIIAELYFMKFSQGPLEALWKRLAYKK